MHKAIKLIGLFVVTFGIFLIAGGFHIIFLGLCEVMQPCPKFGQGSLVKEGEFQGEGEGAALVGAGELNQPCHPDLGNRGGAEGIRQQVVPHVGQLVEVYVLAGPGVKFGGNPHNFPHELVISPVGVAEFVRVSVGGPVEG